MVRTSMEALLCTDHGLGPRQTETASSSSISAESSKHNEEWASTGSTFPSLLNGLLWRGHMRPRTGTSFLPIFCVGFVFLSLFNSFALASASDLLMIPHLPVSHSFAKRAIGNSSKLECLEVVPPVIVPDAAQSPCTQSLMVFSFGNSYGNPFVGKFSTCAALIIASIRNRSHNGSSWLILCRPVRTSYMPIQSRGDELHFDICRPPVRQVCTNIWCSLTRNRNLTDY